MDLFNFAADLARVQAAAYTPNVRSVSDLEWEEAKGDRERILKAHAARRKVLLVALNQKLEDLARGRSEPVATSDDAMRIIADWPECQGLDPRWVGAVWRQGPWVKTGRYRPSSRRRCHARPIPVWRLVDR